VVDVARDGQSARVAKRRVACIVMVVWMRSSVLVIDPAFGNLYNLEDRSRYGGLTYFLRPKNQVLIQQDLSNKHAN
jgi:hypothetical protein